MGADARTTKGAAGGRRRAAVATAATGVVALVLGAGGAPAQATPKHGERYVALGDSYTSGPGIPKQLDANCARSDHNYPTHVALRYRVASFKDASCGGATTKEMWQAQGTNPPQLDALSRNTTLVTVGISGNDIGFGEIIGTCTTLAGTDPTGNPCEKHYKASGKDELAKRIGEAFFKVDKVLDAIHDRAPRARVVVVGYPVIVPDSGVGCRPDVQMADGDVPYLRDTGKRLNSMLRAVAGVNRAKFADTYTPSIGHDVCKPPAERWVEPMVPANPAAPFHPNATGEEKMAVAVLAKLRGAGGHR